MPRACHEIAGSCEPAVTRRKPGTRYTPGAYKAIDDVMAAQAGLVEIVYTL